MARLLSKLSSLMVQKTKEEGLYSDGGGLYLQVGPSGSKSWVFRFQIEKRRRCMGLGPLDTVSLAEARELARHCRRKVFEGLDPIETRIEERNTKTQADLSRMNFDDCAKAYIDGKRAEWSNEKHIEQWTNTLTTYASPILGQLTVDKIDVGLVFRTLQPIWKEKTETATRVRGRIESVLDWATVHKFRSGENPARWRGNLDKLLPKPSKVKPKGHHAALPIDDIQDFMANLRKRDGLAPIALEIMILTALRTSEVLGARWEEFNFVESTWTVPATRMKAKKEHRVPLTPRVLEVLNQLPRIDEFVFPGAKIGSHLSNTSMLEVIKRMELSIKITGHGFRSTFSDWTAERTNFPAEVREMALAHKVENKVEAAYRRGDLFLKRRRLMEKWAEFCSRPIHQGDSVVPIHSKLA